MLRNPSAKVISRFQGHNSTDNLENIAADFWSDSMNVIVNSKGSAEAMRSPKHFNAASGTTNPILSMADYLNPFEHRVLFDIDMGESHETGDSKSESSEDGEVSTFKIENDFTNTLLRSDQHNEPFVSIVVNQQLYRLNKYEYIQHSAANPDFPTWDVFDVGVTAPASAPTISYVGSGGTGQIIDSLTLSYAYMNSRTGEVSIPSDDSNTLGASAANDQVAIPVVASTQHGVDKIVFFLTLDGGSQPFLLIDSIGDPVTKANATTTYDIDLGTIALDTLTPETIFNNLPPMGGKFQFIWKDRVFITGFDGSGGIPTTDIAYSGLESIYMGIPQSCFPPLNRLSAAAKGEVMAGGCATQLGALFMSDLDSYLLSGEATDKTSGPEATTAVSEVFQPMKWQIGSKSPKTIQNTPFGTVWLDQTLRLRIWPGQGFPSEAGLPLRNQLADLDLNEVGSIEGQWYQFSDDGGVYALTGKSASTGQQRLYLMSMYQDPATGQQMTGFAISSIQAYNLLPVWDNGYLTMFMGGIDRLFTILKSNQAGDGWGLGASIFFEMVFGNENNFQKFHSIRFDAAADLTKLTVTIRDMVKDSDGNSEPADIATARTITVERDDDEGGAAYGLIDEYGRRKIIRFAFNPSDDTRDVDAEGSASDSDSGTDALSPARVVKNIAVIYANSKRVI